MSLVRIKDGEMKVLDHKGDNFLGGTDFDQLIVEKLVVPKLKAKFAFADLEKELTSAEELTTTSTRGCCAGPRK
ncbi:MAG: Hsp70 family protein [Hymenobacter sp.]